MVVRFSYHHGTLSVPPCISNLHVSAQLPTFVRLPTLFPVMLRAGCLRNYVFWAVRQPNKKLPTMRKLAEIGGNSRFSKTAQTLNQPSVQRKRSKKNCRKQEKTATYAQPSFMPQHLYLSILLPKLPACQIASLPSVYAPTNQNIANLNAIVKLPNCRIVKLQSGTIGHCPFL